MEFQLFSFERKNLPTAIPRLAYSVVQHNHGAKIGGTT